MHPMLNTAIKAARRAGAIINRGSQNLDILEIKNKKHHDFVSNIDHAAEQEIIKILSQAYPDHAILAEESGTSGASEFEWIIDPLDGTTNFIHGFPQYAVSIALSHEGVISQAVIFDPYHNDLFTASRGGGAFMNDRRIRVSKRTQLQESLIGTGFPFREFGHVDAYLRMFRDFLQKTSGVRRPGAASLDLAYVAAGRLDGFWETGLEAWDIAAGCLLITEAGGRVGDLQGNDCHLKTGNIVAGNPKIFDLMIETIKPYLTPQLIA